MRGKDETGNRYGRLKVLSHAGKSTDNHHTWNCLCDCGNYCIVQGDLLRDGGSTSCGCYRKEHSAILGKINGAKRRIQSRQDSTWRRLYKSHRANARSRNMTPIDFSIWQSLVKTECFYCGKQPELRTYQYGDPVFANGVDRIDSSIDYVLPNTVPCCSQCNRAKMDNTQLEFFEMCLRVVQKHRLGI